MICYKDKELIKVVSGIRRCGKSTLFEIYKDYLRENGVEERQMVSINFEELDYEHLKNYRDLYAYIKERLLPEKMNYIFLDEIQHVVAFENASIVISRILRWNQSDYAGSIFNKDGKIKCHTFCV